MGYNPEKHHRRSIRLRGWDYRNAGAYFVTIVTRGRHGWFDTDVYRQIVENEWDRLPEQFPTLVLDAFVVMPNHVHFIVWLNAPDNGAGGEMRFDSAQPTLGQVVRAFKAVTSRRIHQANGDDFAWQRNYYERVIRNERELNAVRQYICDNPVHWAEDTENPTRAM